MVGLIARAITAGKKLGLAAKTIGSRISTAAKSVYDTLKSRIRRDVTDEKINTTKGLGKNSDHVSRETETLQTKGYTRQDIWHKAVTLDSNQSRQFTEHLAEYLSDQRFNTLEVREILESYDGLASRIEGILGDEYYEDDKKILTTAGYEDIYSNESKGYLISKLLGEKFYSTYMRG